MKKTQKKIVAVLLCALMILGCGTSSFAEEAPDSTVVTETAPDSTTATQEQKAADDAGLTEEAADVTGTEDPAGDTEETDLPDGVETQDESLSSEEQTAAEGIITVDRTFFCEDENISAEVHVSGTVDLTGLTDVSEEQIEMKAVPQSEEQPEYEAAKAYAEENSADEAEIDVTVLDLEFTCGGQPVDVSACEITAEITPSEKLQEEAETLEVSDEIADEAEIGIQLMALTANDAGETEEADSVTVEKGAEDVPKMAVALNAAEPKLQIVTREANNPKFTVQYYANLEVTNRSDDGRLKILNTDNGGNNQGGKLPTNGGNTPTTGLYLVDAGNGKQKIQTHMELTELYTANEYEYFSAPSLPYVNIFRNNGNYVAKEVWVLNGGASASSTNKADWTVYENINLATELHFTNNPDKADDPNTIYIKDGTVIRLVADQSTSGYSNDATFYDYDITDDGETTWDGNGSHGINSGSNYTGSGSKLAFGNKNTGTGLGGEEWNGNTLNAYNKNSLEGCTFGLVTGLNDEGHIEYADKVNAPNLFDDGEAQGKITHNGWSLGFNRSGDTYTLSSVTGENTTKVDGLEYFNNPVTDGTPYENIWTNNFWPMDKNPGEDGLTGEYYQHMWSTSGSWDAKATRRYFGYDGNQYYPSSDDGIDHNNLFGMQYEVKFKLTEDYVGPLEYYFFGDDDMWVFLDGRLVCDIGGVHSSVGAYVNLWDYIAKGDAGEHTLKFYYTERGLSGSTCYMQFTLPSVSTVPPAYQNSQLRVEKEVEGPADPSAEFSFDITIAHTDQAVANSDYSIARYKDDGTFVESTLLSGGTGTFKLKADEYVIINYLQHGTTYTIRETNVPDGCIVSNTIDSGTPSQSETVTGSIQQGAGTVVVFTNAFRPKLPNTGGTGTTLFVFGGMFLMGLAYAGITYRKRKGMR